MKHFVIIGIILVSFIICACGKSRQELMIGEWEIKRPKKPNYISNLKLNPDHTGSLVKPHALLDIKEIPLTWLLEGDNLIIAYQERENPETYKDTLEIMNVNLKSMNIRKGTKEDVLVRIK